jgi:hypothetical protein
MPAQAYSCPVSAPSVCVAATAVSRPETGAWHIRVVNEEGAARLAIQPTHGGEDNYATCEHIVLKADGTRLKIAVSGKQVAVCGPFGKATADSLTRNEGDGSFVLEGSVRLSYHKDGLKAEVSAEHVVVGVADGHLEVKPGPKRAQDFEFWTGFFR